MSRPHTTRQTAKLSQIKQDKRAGLWLEVRLLGMQPHPTRYRSASHMRFVKTLCCIVCRHDPPSDPHHLKFAQPRARGLKSGDQWTIPICRRHHDAVELAGNEENWWIAQGIDPLPLAKELWEISREQLKASRMKGKPS